MKPISKIRFDALAGYARMPMARVMAEELGWYEYANERVLGMLFRDRTDGDYAGLIFGRDRRGRYRSVSMSDFDISCRHAEVLLRRELERMGLLNDEQFHQGDEQGKPIDFFAPAAPRERLNPGFVGLSESKGYGAARRIIEPMMRWYEDPDGNFIEQFQTTGFDTRLWELYLFAAVTEMGYLIDREHAFPDFGCYGPLGEFAVEATTVGPSRNGTLAQGPDLETDAGRKAFLREYMPMKFGGPLFDKLRKEYWKLPHVIDKPLVFAIADFQGGAMMTISASALPIYLYGYTWDWEKKGDEPLKIIPQKVAQHTWGGKVIPSGFFDLPEAENVSAVLFSNAATISKFVRMGTIAGFGTPDVRIFRAGTAVNLDPNATEPLHFDLEVTDPTYTEDWVEGLEVFHNPQALNPLEPWRLPGASHHRLLPDGQIQTWQPDWVPLASVTRILEIEGDGSNAAAG